MTATIQADFGFQGYADFSVDFAGSKLIAYASNCSNCESGVNQGVNYFNYSSYQVDYGSLGRPGTILDGYNFTGVNVSSPFCFKSFGASSEYCGPSNYNVDIATRI
jgi:hypothetical protein